tara:strand:+ start:577 stop:810 length:234 start_codon:yes stop_codon:yes gene_type:complete
MIKLGGNINLEGFDKLNQGELAVFKKIVGNRVRDISNKVKSYECLTLNLNVKQISALLQVDGKNITAKESCENLFLL